LIAATCRVK